MKTNHFNKINSNFCFNIFFIGLIIIFPVVYCILGAFKTPAEFMSAKLLPNSFGYLENFKNALHQAPMFRYMINSFIMAFGGTVVRLVFAVCAAYALTHYDFKGKNFCFFLVLEAGSFAYMYTSSHFHRQM